MRCKGTTKNQLLQYCAIVFFDSSIKNENRPLMQPIFFYLANKSNAILTYRVAPY